MTAPAEPCAQVPPAAVLWDMDGTLVNTEPYWIEAEIELADRDGGRWTHADGLSLVGSALLHAASQLRQRAGVRGTDEQIVSDLLDRVIARVRQDGVIWQPGARALLDELAGAGIPCALVTMSYRSLAEVIVSALPHGTFQAVVTGDAVSHGKPHPEPYLTAARWLGVDPVCCVAIEDSTSGLASAWAAGSRVIAVQGPAPVTAVPGMSRATDLSRVDLSHVRRIASGEVLDLS